MSLVLLGGCGGPVEPDAGMDGGRDAGGRDAVVSDAGLLAYGARCSDGDQCDSAVCLQGFCSRQCRPDRNDCDVFEDGRSYACLEGIGASYCYRVCSDGEGCAEDESCSNVNLADERRWVCTPSCRADGDCLDGEICATSNPVAWLAYQCIPTPSGTHGAGEECDVRARAVWPCASSADCFAGWACNEGTCRAPASSRCHLGQCERYGRCPANCERDDDCPEAMRCALAVYRTGQGLAYQQYFCVDADGSADPCTRASDCADTGGGGVAEVCYAPTFLDGACRTAPDPSMYAASGEPCDDDPLTAEVEQRMCASGLCVFGRCTDLCEADGDCPGAAICTEFSYWDWPVHLCNSFTSCTEDSDCAVDETCGWVFTPTGVENYCFRRRGDLPTGAECTLAQEPFLPPEERCESGDCQGFYGRAPGMGRCDGLCASDDDCPVDFVCERYQLPTETNRTLDPTDDLRVDKLHCDYVPGSQDPCTSTADCLVSGEFCYPHYDVAGVWAPLCVTGSTGGAAPGEPCGDGCAQVLCLRQWLGGQNYCSMVCGTDDDCPPGLVCRRHRQVGADGRMCIDPADPRGGM